MKRLTRQEEAKMPKIQGYIGQLEFLTKEDFKRHVFDMVNLQGFPKKLVYEALERAGIEFKKLPSSEDKSLSQNSGEIITLQQLKNQNLKTNRVRISGKLNNGKLFWTIFPIYKNQNVPFVVTEDKKIIQVKEETETICNRKGEPIKKKKLGIFFFEYEGERYQFIYPLFYDGSHGINSIDNGVFKFLELSPKKHEIYGDTVKEIKNHFDHSNELEYNFMFSSEIITYIQWGVGKTYYEMISGKEDTGKSTRQILNSYLQMNGWFGGKGSVPFMARLKHFFGISANQDEFEKMHKDEKTNYMGVLNTGFGIKGTYNFVNMNKRDVKEQLQTLYTFGFNSFSTNSFYGFDKSFLSRCHKVVGVRKNRETKDILNLSQIDVQRFQELRNKIFAYCLLNYSEIENDINLVRIELEREGTFGRLTDLYSLILGILKHFKEDYRKEKEELMQREGLDKMAELDTKEGAVFEFITELFKEKSSTISILNKDICNYVNSKLGLSEEIKLKPRSVGAMLRNFDLIKRKDQTKRTSEGYEYFLGINSFKDILQRYGFKEQLEKLEKIQEQNPSSLCSGSSGSSSKNEHNEHNEHNEPTPYSSKKDGLSVDFEEAFK